MILADAIMSNVFEVGKVDDVMNEWLKMDLFTLPFYYFFQIRSVISILKVSIT